MRLYCLFWLFVLSFVHQSWKALPCQTFYYSYYPVLLELGKKILMIMEKQLGALFTRSFQFHSFVEWTCWTFSSIQWSFWPQIRSLFQKLYTKLQTKIKVWHERSNNLKNYVLILQKPKNCSNVEQNVDYLTHGHHGQNSTPAEKLKIVEEIKLS